MSTTYYTLNLDDERGNLAVLDYGQRIPSHDAVNAKMDQYGATLAVLYVFDASTALKHRVRTYDRES